MHTTHLSRTVIWFETSTHTSFDRVHRKCSSLCLHLSFCCGVMSLDYAPSLFQWFNTPESHLFSFLSLCSLATASCSSHNCLMLKLILNLCISFSTTWFIICAFVKLTMPNMLCCTSIYNIKECLFSLTHIKKKLISFIQTPNTNLFWTLLLSSNHSHPLLFFLSILFMSLKALNTLTWEFGSYH